MQRHTSLRFALLAFAGALLLVGALSIALGIGITNSLQAAPLGAEPTMVGTLTQANPTVVYLVSPTATKPPGRAAPHPTAPIIHAQPPTPQPTAPRSTPTPCGPCNPWGYNFSCCRAIFDPPAAFCQYFACEPGFWSEPHGFILECAGHLFTQSGGQPGACAKEGGFIAQLYAPDPNPTPQPSP